MTIFSSTDCPPSSYVNRNPGSANGGPWNTATRNCYVIEDGEPVAPRRKPDLIDLRLINPPRLRHCEFLYALFPPVRIIILTIIRRLYLGSPQF